MSSEIPYPDEVEVELDEVQLKDLIADIDTKDVKLTNMKIITEFITGIISGAYRFPVVISLKDSKNILINSDKLKVVALFLDNKFKLDEHYTILHYDEGYASDLPDFIIKNICEIKVPVIYVNDKEFNKDVMDNLAKELNFYPYPSCINSII